MTNSYFNELFAGISDRLSPVEVTVSEDGYARYEAGPDFVVDMYCDAETNFLYLSCRLGEPRERECGKLLRSLLVANHRHADPLGCYFSYNKELRSILVFSNMQLLNLTPERVLGQFDALRSFVADERQRLIDDIFF